MVHKVRGFSLNSEGTKQLNFDVKKRSVLDKIQQSQDDLKTKHHVTKSYKFELRPHLRQLQMEIHVLEKRIVDPHTTGGPSII